MTLDEYLQQEAAIRPNVHWHDGVLWKQSAAGCAQPQYPLQVISPGSARPAPRRSWIRYSHLIPGPGAGGAVRTRLLLQGDRLRDYSMELLDGTRRKAIRKAVRAGCRIEPIPDLEPHRDDLLEIYASNADRNLHGLPGQWYRDHPEEWWSHLRRETSLAGREWTGAFLDGRLVAFSYACLVDHTLHLLVTKCHTDHLNSRPVDLLEFEVIRGGRKRPECRRIDVGWSIPVPPSIDWRKISLGFEPVELPVFVHANPLAMGLIRGVLFAAGPLLKLGPKDANRGLLFKARTIRKRLESLSEDA